MAPRPRPPVTLIAAALLIRIGAGARSTSADEASRTDPGERAATALRRPAPSKSRVATRSSAAARASAAAARRRPKTPGDKAPFMSPNPLVARAALRRPAASFSPGYFVDPHEAAAEARLSAVFAEPASIIRGPDEEATAGLKRLAVSMAPTAPVPPGVSASKEAEMRSVYELLRSDYLFFEEFMSHNPWVPLYKSDGLLLPMIGNVRFMFSMEGSHLGFYSQHGSDPPMSWFKELRPLKIAGENMWAQPLPPVENAYSGYKIGLRRLLGTGAFHHYSSLHDPDELHTLNQLAHLFQPFGGTGVPIYSLFKIISYDSLCDLVLWRFLHLERLEAVDVFLTSEERFNVACLENLARQHARADERERREADDTKPSAKPRPSRVKQVLRGLRRGPLT